MVQHFVELKSVRNDNAQYNGQPQRKAQVNSAQRENITSAKKEHVDKDPTMQHALQQEDAETVLYTGRL